MFEMVTEELDPGNSDAWVDKTVVFTALGRFDDADAARRKAREIQSESFGALFTTDAALETFKFRKRRKGRPQGMNRRPPNLPLFQMAKNCS